MTAQGSISHPGARTISRTVAILGTGTMGRGIAQVVAQKGHSTRVFDALPGRAKEAIGAISAQMEGLVTKGKITADERAKTLHHLSFTEQSEDACAGADVVIEAVPEDMALKVSLLKAVLPVLAPNAIIASNTSSLSLTELGAKLGVADRTIGLHFFNPPPVMQLIEIVRGLSTSEDTIARATEFSIGLGKTPILVNDVPGFATSRLGVILGAEAMRMLESGVASAEDIDRGMELGYRHPMGPLRLTDLVGLDVRLAIADHLHRELKGDQYRAPELMRRMVAEGKLGKKTGQGFYGWS